MRVAVVGSGVAGLTATRNLHRLGHHVTLYEERAGLGASFHRAQVPDRSSPGGVDVPLRITSSYRWPELSRLADEAGVEMMPMALDSSYSDLDGKTHFLHERVSTPFGRMTIPTRLSFLVGGRGILAGIARFRWFAGRDLGRPETAALTFEEWFRDRGFDPEFGRVFVEPTLRLACTCSQEAIRAYPAPILIEFLDCVFHGGHHFQRFRFGTRDLADRLAETADEQRLGRSIRAVEQSGEEVAVVDGEGCESRFDHVVVATQANQAARLLGDRESEARALLERIPYEAGEMIVHTDERLMPRDRRGWTAVNYISSLDRTSSMATVWTNAIEPSIAGSGPILQTWNPVRPPAPESIVLRVPLERPVVTLDSRDAIDGLLALGERPDRRISFVGSYADHGMPLLETAVTSSHRACRRLGPIEVPAAGDH